MKKWVASILLFSVLHAYGQSPVAVSSTGIGDIKINMTLAQVEKITGQTITFKTGSAESYAMDSALVSYKGIQLTIEFFVSGEDEQNKPQKKVYSIAASHPSLQTRSGFSLGSDKFEIVKKLDGMTLTLQPDWRMENKPGKSNFSMLMLTDGENGTQLLMYFEDNKLTGFYVSLFEGC